MTKLTTNDICSQIERYDLRIRDVCVCERESTSSFSSFNEECSLAKIVIMLNGV